MGKPIDWAALSEDERSQRIKRLPAWAQEYIEHLRGEIEDYQEDAQDELKAESYDAVLADLWQAIGVRRVLLGDTPGFARATRAARLIQSVDGL